MIIVGIVIVVIITIIIIITAVISSFITRTSIPSNNPALRSCF
jgi:hypothetical protein